MIYSGLSLSLEFFTESKPLLQDYIPDVMGQAAFGLVGEGSECFGFDDEISRDHDWGAAFCLWLPREKLRSCKERIESALSKLPGTFKGYSVRIHPNERMGRVGPIAIEDFYARFVGMERPQKLGRSGAAFQSMHWPPVQTVKFFKTEQGRSPLSDMRYSGTIRKTYEGKNRLQMHDHGPSWPIQFASQPSTTRGRLGHASCSPFFRGGVVYGLPTELSLHAIL